MNTGGPQRLDSLPGVGLHHVGDDDMSGILPADGHVDDGAYAVTGDVRHAQPVHQLVVAGGYLHAVHFGDDAAAADLLNIRHPAAVDLPAIGPLQAFADGVAGSALRQSGVLHQLLVLHLMMVDAVDLKHALGQGAGLVKDHRFGLGQSLQIVRALTSTPALLAPPMPAKKLRGMLMTRAQGQLATRKVRAR